MNGLWQGVGRSSLAPRQLRSWGAGEKVGHRGGVQARMRVISVAPCQPRSWVQERRWVISCSMSAQGLGCRRVGGSSFVPCQLRGWSAGEKVVHLSCSMLVQQLGCRRVGGSFLVPC